MSSNKAGGKNRFDFFLKTCEDLLTKASSQKNPGLWLYQNNFRTPLFMLEALSKLYANVHNTKKFTKLKERFKVLEDVLGAADYYDCFAKEFSLNKKIPATVIAFMKAQTNQRIVSLNDSLIDKDWLITNKRISKIKEDLLAAKWLKQKKEIDTITEFYQSEIKKIIAFVTEKKFVFGNLENDVHELRRKLRWLSIYPQALRGCIQLTANTKVPKTIAKYLTKEITTSPFNKMPDANDNVHFLMLEQNHFYALSWMIAELGKIKDNGLRIFALVEALQQTEKLSEADALKKAYQLLGKKQPTVDNLLSQAGTISKTYFKEKSLEALVVGEGSVKE